jgi:hypothetical protein
VGFVFDLAKSRWEERFQQLSSFVDEYGTADVPIAQAGYESLAQWLADQRRRARSGVLRNEHKTKLAMLGASWGRDEAKGEAWWRLWTAMSQELKRILPDRRFVRSIRESGNTRLANWLELQHAAYQARTLDKRCIKLLGGLGIRLGADESGEPLPPRP